MKKFTICVGLFDKESKKQEIGTLDAYKIVSNIFVDKTGGATITEGRGIYTHDDGSIVVEPSLVCMVYGSAIEAVKEAADLIKVALNQESVAIETAEVESVFY